MAAISSTVGAQTAAQAALQQLRVQQAKQNAERAEFTARALRAEANNAQHEADRAQDKARSLHVRSGQAQTAAGQARQGLAMLKSLSDMQANLVNTVNQVNERQGEARPVSASTPVVNTSGQLTGTVVNVVA